MDGGGKECDFDSSDRVTMLILNSIQDWFSRGTSSDESELSTEEKGLTKVPVTGMEHLKFYEKKC